jgi:hypothetical protein
MRRTTRRSSLSEHHLSMRPHLTTTPLDSPNMGAVAVAKPADDSSGAAHQGLFDMSCAGPMTRLHVQRLNDMVAAPAAGLHYMSSPGMSTMPSLSPSLAGSPTEPPMARRQQRSTTPQTPQLAFVEQQQSSMAQDDQQLLGQYPMDWPMAWQVEAFATYGGP